MGTFPSGISNRSASSTYTSVSNIPALGTYNINKTSSNTFNPGTSNTKGCHGPSEACP
jgi:hypothetical protein